MRSTSPWGRTGALLSPRGHLPGGGGAFPALHVTSERPSPASCPSPGAWAPAAIPPDAGAGGLRGLVVSQVVTLLMTPVLYTYFDQLQSGWEGRARGCQAGGGRLAFAGRRRFAVAGGASLFLRARPVCVRVAQQQVLNPLRPTASRPQSLPAPARPGERRGGLLSRAPASRPPYLRDWGPGRVPAPPAGARATRSLAAPGWRRGQGPSSQNLTRSPARPGLLGCLRRAFSLRALASRHAVPPGQEVQAAKPATPSERPGARFHRGARMAARQEPEKPGN